VTRNRKEKPTNLNSAVENEDVSVVSRLEDENVLVERLLNVKNLLDTERHGLTCSIIPFEG
jgi:hypothetical protein